MKDSEFIELLNLYLDHEISAEDAARIEAEVQTNPDRRRTYREYCRLQKACTLLAKDYVEQATETSLPEGGKIVAFAPKRSWGAGVYAGGLAMAAACVALVVAMNHSNYSVSAPTTANSVATVSPAAKTPAAVNASPVVATDASQAIAQTIPEPAPRAGIQPIFTASPLSRSAGTSLANAEQQGFESQFDWIKQMQIPSIQLTPADQLRFDTKTDFKSTPKTFGPGRIENGVQNAAFRFQR